ncbi:MAG: DUF4037 domain-containing protein, partial [Chloroflexi bacterium]|nr:DUF4037 domain-containing protein [Chloroflexota bacterium]
MKSGGFLPGLELSRRFYAEAVRPLLDQHFPALQHAAAQIGTGSDILDFDDPISADHDWGPAVTLVLREAAWEAHADAIEELMAQQLPFTFLGYPVHSAQAPGEDPGTSIMTLTHERPISHSVWPTTVRRMFKGHLDWDIDQPLSVVDWLTFPSQLLRGLTGGAVHIDQTGELTVGRQQLAWYPEDVWRYM